ncbi:MAG TPA: DegT/DnrJ/EryC1/StrS family aminotransferase [Chitinophagaceae bacterium]|nr:DegT/DnrJ/EryC1/StrS family aminotransferase [Chitinophagaceae bacterium]
MIPVTRSFLPPIEEYQHYLQKIWQSAWLTNRGPLLGSLEKQLKQYLDVPHLLITNNGTLPIQIALKLLAGNGEVITTPYSYVATTSSIVWEQAKPVFADIEPDTLTISPAEIEKAITPRTTCILATHVFGNPCDTLAIDEIARQHKLHVIYDAAHCFGVRYKNKSLFTYGDISTCSFHATKVFHTAEGGAAFCNNEELIHPFFYHHNFGHNGPLDFFGPGINAKCSELNAAMGLSVLPYMQDILSTRRNSIQQYVSGLHFNAYRIQELRPETEWNYSYFPLIFDSEKELLAVQQALHEADIFPRRYFFPSLNTLPYVQYQPMPVSEQTARCSLCLPLFAHMPEDLCARIIEIVNDAIN